MTSVERVKREIDQAMEHREARVAILIGDNIRNALDMLDEQPTAVMEALIERGKQLQLSGNAPKHRHDLRAAFIKYLEQRLHEARARERRLAQAITGAEDLSDDYKPGMS
jgi:carbonic anhydrase